MYLTSKRFYYYLAVTTTIGIFILMVLGSYVKAIDAGLSCPDWPLCYDQIFPTDYGSYTFEQVMSEYIHRLIAMFIGFFIIGLLYLSYKYRNENSISAKRFYLMVLMSFLLLIQVGLGALTVTELLDPMIVTSHLAFATVIFGLSVLHSTWVE